MAKVADGWQGDREIETHAGMVRVSWLIDDGAITRVSVCGGSYAAQVAGVVEALELAGVHSVAGVPLDEFEPSDQNGIWEAGEGEAEAVWFPRRPLSSPIRVQS